MAGIFRVADLLVTQAGLRNIGQLPAMIEFVRQGGRFTQDARLAFGAATGQGGGRPIHLASLTDFRTFVHDGHHRLVAMLLGGRDAIDHQEVEVGHWSYEDYRQAAPERGWFTPFDLDAHVRVADFRPYRELAARCWSEMPGYFPVFARNHADFYRTPRRLWTVRQLAESLGDRSFP